MKLPLKIFLIALAVVLGGYGVARVQAQTRNTEPTMPVFKTVNAVVGDTTVCYSKCAYLMIANANESKALAKINRQNYEQLFGKYASTTTIDIEGALERMRLEDFKLSMGWDEEYVAPLYSRFSQKATLSHHNKLLCIATFGAYNWDATGWVHDQEFMRFSNFNLSTGELIDLSYIAKGKWVNALNKLIFDKLDPSIQESHKDYEEPIDYASLAEIKITGNGLLFRYSPEVIAEYMWGFVDVELSNEELASLGVPMPWI